MWQVLESLVDAGKLKNIGVSNFSVKKLSQASSFTQIHTRAHSQMHTSHAGTHTHTHTRMHARTHLAQPASIQEEVVAQIRLACTTKHIVRHKAEPIS